MDVPIQYGPSTEVNVRALESKYAVQLPQDFRDFLLKCIPQHGPHVHDDNYLIWWPLEEIKNISDEYNQPITNTEIAEEAESYLFFMDFALWCWAYAICCKPGRNFGRVVVIGYQPDIFVADSFSEFVELYVTEKVL